MFDGFLETFVHEYRLIHLGIGLLGNVFFIVGSSLFLFESGQQPVPGSFWPAALACCSEESAKHAHGLDNRWRALQRRREQARQDSRAGQH